MGHCYFKAHLVIATHSVSTIQSVITALGTRVVNHDKEVANKGAVRVTRKDLVKDTVSVKVKLEFLILFK